MINKYKLDIIADNQPTVMEQIFRVARYRGFKVEGLSMALISQGEMLSIQMTVSSSRAMSLLHNQLLKLVDVQRVDLEKANFEKVDLEKADFEKIGTERSQAGQVVGCINESNYQVNAAINENIVERI